MRTDARFDSIDALRGLAISLVIVYHAGPLAWRLPPYGSDGWLVWPTLGWKWLLVPFWHFGFAGVHLFFVLSGFCIHLRMARKPGPIDLRTYALRRFWRIYPPYWIALVIFGLAVPLLAGAMPPLSDVLLHAGMLHTLHERSFFSINPAFWSLATEEQFYLAYPLLVILLGRFGVRRVLVGALAVSLAWRAAALLLLPPTVDTFMAWRVLVHGLFVPRWFEWLLGCWLAELAANPSQPLAGRSRLLAVTSGILLGLAMLTRLHVAADKLLSDTLFGCGFAAMTGAFLGAQEKARTFPAPAGGHSRFARKVGPVFFFRGIGRRAYGLYLVHQPILDWGALAMGLRLPVAVAAGWLFSQIFERPFEKKSQEVTRPPSVISEVA